MTSEPTRVWAWGTINISDPGANGLEHGNSMESFISKCMETNSVMQFFNLKFDGHFIVDWLLKNGYAHVELGQFEGLKPRQFKTLISNKGVFYSMSVKWPNGHTTEFRDAAKKFPNMSVASVAKAFKLEISKGDIDYHAERSENHQLTGEELDYLDRDVRIVAYALRETIDSGMSRLTVGADALAEYKSLIGGEGRFRNLFPLLSDEMDAEIRRAYRGGFTYLTDRYKGKRLGAGITLDVNSLYPSVMANELIPYGMPEFVRGKVLPTSRRPLTIFSVTFTAKIKADHIPCIQIKGSSIFGDTEYLSEINEPTTLMVTNVDWQLYLEHYDIDIIAYGGGWRFKAVDGLFRQYIDKWSAIKEKATGGQREIAKGYLNNLYGKFASNPNVTGKVPILEDGRVRYVLGKSATKEPVYTAAGVFITSYARAITIRAAQRSYPVFAYADTDSLHLLTDTVPEGIDVDPVRMGAWKLEYRFIEAHYVRSKVYLVRIADENRHSAEDCLPTCILRHDYKTAFAGLPQGVAGALTFDDISEGKVFHGKLQPRSVVGGVILEDKTFTLKLT